MRSLWRSASKLSLIDIQWPKSLKIWLFEFVNCTKSSKNFGHLHFIFWAPQSTSNNKCISFPTLSLSHWKRTCFLCWRGKRKIGIINYYPPSRDNKSDGRTKPIIDKAALITDHYHWNKVAKVFSDCLCSRDTKTHHTLGPVQFLLPHFRKLIYFLRVCL